MVAFSSVRAAFVLATLVVLGACAAPPPPEPPVVPGYEAREDGGFTIDAVPSAYIPPENRRATVTYSGSERPGTIVVDPVVKYLYHVNGDGTAERYRIAVGAEGRTLRSASYVGHKREWPYWAPTANMIRTQPKLYAHLAGGMKPGPMNPLGARALYLYRGGKDTMYRIHGTGDYTSVGHATSAGCIRLYNQDILELYANVTGRPDVKVRSVAESRRMEGDDAVEAALAQEARDIAALDDD